MGRSRPFRLLPLETLPGLDARFSGDADSASLSLTGTSLDVTWSDPGGFNNLNYDLGTAPYDTLSELAAAVTADTGGDVVLSLSAGAIGAAPSVSLENGLFPLPASPAVFPWLRL